MRKKITLVLSALLFAFLLSVPPRNAMALDRLVEVLAVGVTDGLGLPVVNGTVTFYDAGTTTLRTVYQDWALSTTAANPATLDSAGRIVVYSDKRIKLVIKDNTGSTVRTLDNVGTADSDIATSAVAGGIPTAVPTGVILPYGGATAPSGWLLCDGSQVNQTQYAALYAVISTSFNTGGETAGYFRLPGTARRTLVGAGGSGTSTLANSVGSRGGEETHTPILAEMFAHNHGGTNTATVGFATTNASGLPATNVQMPIGTNSSCSSGTLNAFDATTGPAQCSTWHYDSGITGLIVNGTGSHSHTITDPGHSHVIPTQGSSTAFNVMQPSLVVNYIIKY
jgi:microcystin-dependent protein